MAVRRFGLVVVAAGLLVAGAACSSDAEPKGPTATVGTLPPTTTSTTSIEDVEARVEAAQAAATAAYYEVLAEPDPDDERLRVHRSGRSLESVQETVRDLASHGQAVRYGSEGPPVAEIESVEIGDGGRTAELVACIVDQAQLVEMPSENVLNDDVASSRVRYELRLEGSEWNVVNAELIAKFEGRTQCS